MPPFPKKLPMKVPFAFTAVILAAGAVFSVRALGEPGTLVCGGIGSDERAALADQARGANLALELFVAKRGDYVAGTRIEITALDGAGRGRTIDATADGPICYTKLAPGRYRVEGELNGVIRSARAVVPGHSRHPVHVALAFPEDAVRGGVGPEPTPHEREEARTP